MGQPRVPHDTSPTVQDLEGDSSLTAPIPSDLCHYSENLSLGSKRGLTL